MFLITGILAEDSPAVHGFTTMKLVKRRCRLAAVLEAEVLIALGPGGWWWHS